MLPMNGLAALATMNATRTMDCSCGISLIFKKFNFEKYGIRELEIIRKRGSIEANLDSVIKLLEEQDNKKKEIRDAILRGLEKATQELAKLPAYALYDEVTDFQLSQYGRIFALWLLCHEKTPEIQTIEDATILWSGFSEEDEIEFQAALDWAAEVAYIKNSDSPSQPENSQKTS